MESKVFCFNCIHFRLKDAGGIAANGFGLCHLKKESWRFTSMSYKRVCDKWLPAKDDVIADRLAWINQGQKK